MTTNDTSRSLSALSAYESDLEKIVTHRLSAEIYGERQKLMRLAMMVIYNLKF